MIIPRPGKHQSAKMKTANGIQLTLSKNAVIVTAHRSPAKVCMGGDKLADIQKMILIMISLYYCLSNCFTGWTNVRTRSDDRLFTYKVREML